ncbi:MAG: hydroxymethylglutaryl-CoA lyase [Acidimicrobiia bacterium]|nr:hydroxymethylglutaryl-CoA lyase [Acidimicrobiia bacterium]
MPESAEIIDVSPRDGLQNEKILLSTEIKVELITRMIDAGMRRLEATSFVHPRLVPAMADAEAVMALVPRGRGASYIGLVLNERGLDRAIAAGCDEIGYAAVVTDTFSQRNQGTTAAEGVEVWKRIATRAREAGVAPSLVVSVAFGCPFEGEVSVRSVVETVEACMDVPPARLSLADTIGVATPADVTERFTAISDVVPHGVQLGTHFHNTRGTGIANAYAALEAGVRSFDSSLGGVGGCPFAPNATGNITTEELVYMLHRMGFDTGLDLDALAATANWLRGHLGESVVSLYAKAGPFPMAESG